MTVGIRFPCSQTHHVRALVVLCLQRRFLREFTMFSGNWFIVDLIAVKSTSGVVGGRFNNAYSY